LRTETTITDSRDFALGRRLHTLPALRVIGFAANRHGLEVERISQDCQLGEAPFDQVNRPQRVDGQRAAALAFGDQRVMALCLFFTKVDAWVIRPGLVPATESVPAGRQCRPCCNASNRSRRASCRRRSASSLSPIRGESIHWPSP
jgi:hypothetical protein